MLRKSDCAFGDNGWGNCNIIIPERIRQRSRGRPGSPGCRRTIWVFAHVIHHVTTLSGAMQRYMDRIYAAVFPAT